MLSDYYLWIKLLHILSAVIVMGTGTGIAFFMFVASRTNNVEAIAITTKHVVLADWLFTAPAVVTQFISGALLVYILGYSLTSAWVVSVLILFCLVGCLWLPVIKIQYGLKAEAQLSREQGSLTVRFKHLMKWWTILGIPAFTIMLGIFYLMVFKPLPVY